MKVIVSLSKAIMILGKMENTISSDMPGIMGIESSDAGIQIEVDDRYHCVPWHAVNEVVAYK